MIKKNECYTIINSKRLKIATRNKPSDTRLSVLLSVPLSLLSLSDSIAES